jgi:anti-anti-sigma regulatory factor
MASAPIQSPVLVGSAVGGGLLVRLAGRCTMQHSPATEATIENAMVHAPGVTVVVDLFNCTYLDSTFLGCLFGLYRRFGATPDARLKMHASPERAKALFGPMRLDKVLKVENAPAPGFIGEAVPLPDAGVDRKTLARHVMDCHRLLAETDTPARAAFLKIAAAMESELG